MSVILQIANFTIAQGSGFHEYMGLTNSGTENVKSLKLKVIDSVVFDTLYVFALSFVNCLNAYSTSTIRNYTDGGYNFPAGTTKNIRLTGTVKAAAPIQVHSLQCDFQYVVY